MNKYRALVHFMVLGSRAPNTINISWAPEISWAPIASAVVYAELCYVLVTKLAQLKSLCFVK